MGAGDVFAAGEGVCVVSCAGVGLLVLGSTGSDVTQDESRVAEPGINFCPLPHLATENDRQPDLSFDAENVPEQAMQDESWVADLMRKCGREAKWARWGKQHVLEQ